MRAVAILLAVGCVQPRPQPLAEAYPLARFFDAGAKWREVHSVCIDDGELGQVARARARALLKDFAETTDCGWSVRFTHEPLGVSESIVLPLDSRPEQVVVQTEVADRVQTTLSSPSDAGALFGLQALLQTWNGPWATEGMLIDYP